MLDLESAIKHYEQLAKNQIKCADRIDELHCDSTTTRYMAEHQRQLAEWLKELKAYKDKDMRLIYVNPLAEAIRCAMCTNPIKSDRGCDGGCKVDEQMYKKVMESVNGLIVEVKADEDSD